MGVLDITYNNLRNAVIFFFLFRAFTDAQNEDRNYWNSLAQETLKGILKHKDNNGVAKNVIFFMGDGYGIPTVVANRIHKGQLNGKPGEETVLSFEEWKDVALIKTYNVNHQVPDSSGTACALLTGVKTNLGVVGIAPNVKRSDCSTYSPEADLKSILSIAAEAGKSVGLVTNTEITHATPANAYAHSPDREWMSDNEIPKKDRTKCKDIALQLLENAKDFQVLFGGGRERFLPNTTPDLVDKSINGLREDGRNLIEEWKNNNKKRNLNFEFVYDRDGYERIDVNKVDRVLGLFEPGIMKYERNRTDTDPPSVAEMTLKAIEILKRNPKGYFLFVEGGLIDKAHHKNYAKVAITQAIMFEKGIGDTMKVINQDDTLVIVTADHSHSMVINGRSYRGNPLFGLDNYYMPFDGKPFTTIMYTTGYNYPAGNRRNLTNKITESFDYQQESAIPIKEMHGGEDVSLYAHGPMAHLFRGVLEQNYVAHVILYASCLGDNKDHCKYMPGAAPQHISVNMTVSMCALLVFCMRFRF